MLWEQWRHEGLTSSDAAAAAGQSSRRSPLKVARTKRAALVLEQRPTTEPMFWGDQMEPGVASEAARRMGMTLERRWGHLVGPRSTSRVYPDQNHRYRETVESTLEPLVRSTPDYIALDRDRSPVIVECKTTGKWKAWEKGIPLNIQWQVQWHMLAGDIPRAIVPVLFFQPVLNLRCWSVDRLPDFEPGGRVSQWARAWWQAHVLDGQIPAAQAIDIPDLTRENPTGNGITVELPSSVARLDTLFVEAFRERAEAMARAKICTAKLKDIEAQLRQIIGPASYGTLGGVTYSLLSTRRGGRNLRRKPKP